MRALLVSLLLLFPAAAAGETPARAPGDWRDTLERAARAVVVLRISVPRAFDTEKAVYATATGFVVDAQRGLILTNRHVVEPGPAVAEAVFLNHEEVDVWAVYRDPVHDFGFYRYDPEQVKFMEPVELQLAPERARVGTEIRVLGNDSGEKLSILAGTLARLDRDAPRYGKGQYNDFNTFYYQAASSTSGGSSGSPVIDRDGWVVALNAGGRRRSAASFYLPLDRVVRALELIRAGEQVPRGTLQAVFRHRSYDELRRLGLRTETETAVRREVPAATGMLIVDEIVPGGPAAGKLEVGDVVVRVEGRLATAFIPIEAVLDERVGEEIGFLVERGGQPVEVAVRVQDLHSITPDAYLELGGAVVHQLSYQMARGHGVPMRGIYVASAGYMFSRAGVPSGVVITEVDGQPVASLDEFSRLFERFPADSRVTVRYFHLKDPRTERVAVVRVDRRWFPMRHCVRADPSGRWPCQAAADPPPAPAPRPAATTFPREDERPARVLAASLVMVQFDVPFRVEGVHGDRFLGAGLVLDAERGLVLVDRDTAPIALGDVRLTFAAAVEIPGEVFYLHPEHNMAVIRYDPALLGDTPVRSAELRATPLEAGDAVWLVGLGRRHDIVAQKTSVARVEAAVLPLGEAPRFRESNMELVVLNDATPTVGGVLADGKGRVLALWASFSTPDEDPPSSFFAGIPAARVLDMVTPLREGRAVGWRSLGAELRPITVAEARARGLPEHAARRFEARGAGRRRVLSVTRLAAGFPSSELLEEGDLLLSVNGEVVISFAQVERAAQAERVELVVLRDGAELALSVPTLTLDGRGLDRCLLWAGAALHAPHHALAAQRGIEREGVYVSWFWYGSPANRARLGGTRRILAVDGQPTPDLDAFLAAVAGRPDGDAVRLRTADLEGKVSVVSLELDQQFWPTVELRRGERGWLRVAH